MPKMRGFKPDLWTDEDFVEVSPFARLLWLGMWNYACDNGHLADKSKQIKMRVLPTDDVNCAELLRELADQGLIERVDGWITVPNLNRHQRIDRRYFTTCQKAGCVPPEGNPTHETRSVPDETTTEARGDHAGTPDEVRGSEGEGERKGRARRAPETALPADWTPTDAHRKYASENRVDVDREAFKFRNHAAANDRRQRNWNAAFTTWLAKATEWAPAATPKVEEWWR